MSKSKAFSRFDARIAFSGGCIGAVSGAFLAFLLFFIPNQVYTFQSGGLLIAGALFAGLIMGFVAGALISVGVSRYRHHTADAAAVPSALS